MSKPEWLLKAEPVFDSVNEAVVISEKGRILFANQTMLRITGYDQADVVGHEHIDFFEPADQQYILDQIAIRNRQGHNRFEYYVLAKSGEHIPVIISSRIHHDSEQREFVIVSITDIREQKKTEACLRDAYAQLEERQEEIDDELALAGRVQKSLAPSNLRWGQVHVESYYSPVRTVGGDFGLVYPRGQELHCIICDVAGHGIGSALLANRVYSVTLHELSHEGDVSDLFDRLNSFLMNEIAVPGFFMTMAWARIHRNARWLQFTSAGHPPALHVRKDGTIEELAARSVPIGLFKSLPAPDKNISLELKPGERLILYSDGLTEVFNADGQILSTEDFQMMIRENAHLSLCDMKQAILDFLAKFRNGPPTDDISLILIEV